MSEMTKEAVLDLLKEHMGSAVRELVQEQQAKGREEARAKGMDTAQLAIQKFMGKDKHGPANESLLNERSTATGRILRYIKQASQRRGSGQCPRGVLDIASAMGDTHVVNMIEASLADPITKAHAEDLLSTGGAMVIPTMLDEVVPTLRQKSVFMKMGPREVPMPTGALSIPYGDTAATASYGAEGGNISESSDTLGQLVLRARKLTAVTAVSNEMLNDTSGRADAFITDSLGARMAVKQDAAFIRSDGTVEDPKGVRYWASESSTTFASGGTSVADISEDLAKAWYTIVNTYVRPVKLGWLMSHREFKALLSARDGNNNRVWADELAAGTLNGYPIEWTQNIPITLGSGSDSEVYLVDFDSVVVGQTTALELSMTDTGSYYSGSALVSTFDTDRSAFRAIARHDIGCRNRGKEVAVVTGVTWGA